MITNYPFPFSLTTEKQTIGTMINLLTEIYLDCNDEEKLSELYKLLEDYTKHLNHLIEAKKIHESIQREIKENKYSRWKQL